MRNGLFFVLKVSLFFTALNGNSQQPVLSVQSFDYIWQKAGTAINIKGQLIIAAEDSIKHRIEKSFARAIRQRWNIEMPELTLSVKPWSLFSLSDAPKFNTKLKEKQPGAWYLFLQIFDTGNSMIYNNSNGSIATELNVKCKVVGFNDSVILDRNILVKMNRGKAAPDQVTLKKLPAYPPSFAKAFDSIATWIFQHEEVTEKNILVQPAYVFTETKFDQQPFSQLEFKNENFYVENLTEPRFIFHIPGPTYVKTKTKKNVGGNIGKGAIALFTGLPVNKKRVFEYEGDFPFELQDSSAYHCFIHYAEVEIADIEREKEKDPNGNVSYSIHSGEYSGGWRKIDPSVENFVKFGSDTLVTFKIAYTASDGYKTYTRFWDGSDSATIIDLPNKLKNKDGADNVILTGRIEDVSFTMRSQKDFTEKQFYINDKLVMITYGKDAPVRAFLFQPLSEQQIKLFTILSSLPYSYFN